MSLRPRNSAERGPGVVHRVPAAWTKRLSPAVGLALAVGALTFQWGCEATDPPPEPAFAYAQPLAPPAPSFVVWVDGVRTAAPEIADSRVTCSPPLASSASVVDAPTAPSVIVEPPPPAAPVIAITPLPTRQVLATGVPECDAYAARVEACSEHTLGTTGERGQALDRIRDSLDAARRSWKVAAESPRVRTMLADECSASLRSYLDTALACRDI